MKKAGLTATFHSLRHAHASTLIAAGLDVLTISRRLGHGSPAITLGVYGHLFKPDDRARGDHGEGARGDGIGSIPRASGANLVPIHAMFTV